jgi:predicted metal-dependent HD superfamily phosphohydrolase
MWSRVSASSSSPPGTKPSRSRRKEYAHVPDFFFRRGRAKILNQFLARPAIYSTPYFRKRFEAQARANIERTLDG